MDHALPTSSAATVPPGPAAALDKAALQEALTSLFAPWVQDLHLQVERF